ncbi:MIP/aquaporin family protein [Calycomorphotria hydatis]|uniref:Aquaporin Z 2 n=1 Tax=Calycomorphotria hydatis TaxID=2528027 RepID=A0A517T6D8_9PLAN|nr:MIP family channel protein [Calycomorphotria hydatis]QDT63939.1 Aquaporin Z 2 [Calycomorphotria hydatis]
MRPLLAEFLGTFCLVFAGCGAVVVNEVTGGAVGLVGIALTFGVIVMAVIYALGDVSGAHINPAATFSFFLAGKFPASRILPYVLVQCAGAIVAAFLLKFLHPESVDLGQTVPRDTVMQSFVMEIVLTAVLMFIVLRVATGSKEQGLMAGIAIGGVILTEVFCGGPISGASMNPARSLGPAIAAMNFGPLWIYLTAPLIGAAIGVACHRLLTAAPIVPESSSTEDD